MSKILSVAIPTYNMEALLARCLNSFIINGMGMDQLEVIVVNDGSKDQSSAIAHEYENRYPQTFKVIDKENGNYGSCINRALKEATGKYFKICDADDSYDTASLEDFISFLSVAESDIVFSPYKVLDFDSNEKSSIAPAEMYLGKTLDIEDVEWGASGLIKYRAMHAMCTRTAILKDNNYIQTGGISYTDTEFVFYSLCYARSCSFFPSPVYRYFVGRDGQTMSYASKVKSHMHFYTNAKRMLDDYVLLPSETGKQKQHLLFESIISCLLPFVEISVLYLKDNKRELELYNGLLLTARQSILPCPIENRILASRYIRLWKQYHVPSIVLYYLAETKHFLMRLKPRKVNSNK